VGGGKGGKGTKVAGGKEERRARKRGSQEVAFLTDRKKHGWKEEMKRGISRTEGITDGWGRGIDNG
jgi:hypothetical protein